MSNTIISLKDIVVEFDGQRVLEGLNLDIHDKEFVTFLGPSGCGKTTTLRIIGGFVDPKEGDVFFEGKRINDLPPHKRHVNTVFQRYALFPHLNVFENIAFGLRIQKVPENQVKERVSEMLALVNLKGYEKRNVNLLSGGQQQRVAIARALVNHPRVLLLDEPLGALDLKLRKEMQIELKRIQKSTGITFIYVTHDQVEAMTMGDRIVVMKDGFIQQVDTPQNLYDLPVNEFVAGFMGSPQMNFIDATLVKEGADYYVTFGAAKIKVPANKVNAEIANYVGKEIVFGIRPEDVHDEPEFIEKHPEARATADVEVTELMGAETYLYLNCEGNALTARVEPTSTAKTGDKITIALDMNKMHLFDKETEKTILN